MISAVGIGSAEIPESAPEEPVVVVIPIVPSMGTDDYYVDWLLPATLPPEDVELTAQDSDTVTLTITRPNGFAGTPGLTIHLICTLDTDIDTEWVDAVSEGFLSTNWTGTAWLRKYGPIVYFRFEVFAGAAIDGTSKFGTLDILTGLASTIWEPVSSNVGTAVEETQQLFVVRTSSGASVVIDPTAGVTGTWDEGDSYVNGQVSWIANS